MDSASEYTRTSAELTRDLTGWAGGKESADLRDRKGARAHRSTNVTRTDPTVHRA